MRLGALDVLAQIGHVAGRELISSMLEDSDEEVLIAAVQSLRSGKVPPVVGLDPAEKDPECDLRTATGAPLKASFDTVLKTSYGFGGTNAALVLGRYADV